MSFAHFGRWQRAQPRLRGQKKYRSSKNALVQRGHMKLAIRLPAQAIAGIQASATTRTRNDPSRKNRSLSGSTSSNIPGMQPRSTSQRTADLRFRSRQAVSNERLVPILLAADRHGEVQFLFLERR